VGLSSANISILLPFNITVSTHLTSLDLTRIVKLAELAVRISKEIDRGCRELSDTPLRVQPLLQALDVYVLHGALALAGRYQLIALLVLFAETDPA
jgi:hypothetical protein